VFRGFSGMKVTVGTAPDPVTETDSMYFQGMDGDIPSETGYTYDGAGRQTAAISYHLGTETWRTTTSYGGNVTTTVPPEGGTAESTFTDARGNRSTYFVSTGGPLTCGVARVRRARQGGCRRRISNRQPCHVFDITLGRGSGQVRSVCPGGSPYISL
jgi:hypothetical protein